ncbi:hypothetical protein [Ancylomarina longa]|uniref:Uncharacterized protein n=1 Tax=Ancylomarina longa TaxID=2487017 RepID=A0A434AGF4_9BACT|nr:hypothetical protein [Ancylomarina longa]RUT73464.1 hypothetical protein DLK05_13365 [Ancylomarina longa]
MASVLFHGQMDWDEDQNPQYSSYIEFGYSRFIGGKKFSWVVGITPYKGFYDDHLNVINVNMSMYDQLNITDKFSLSVCVGITVNPATERLFLTFAVSL